MRPPLNIVWLKKDLRLSDHAPFAAALQDQSAPFIALHCFEPSVQNSPSWDARHWWFTYHSLVDMRPRLAENGIALYHFHQELIPLLEQLQQCYCIQHIYSHEETGIGITYERDKALKVWCEEQHVQWTEFACNGVERGRKNRDQWSRNWAKTMKAPIIFPDWTQAQAFHLTDDVVQLLEQDQEELPIGVISLSAPFVPDPVYQTPGETVAKTILQSFIDKRHAKYFNNISKPLASRTYCSRLSAHLAYGNLSIRQAYQAAIKAGATKNKHLGEFASRLIWHCHFIQKFEMEDRMEFENQNSAFNGIRVKWDQKKFDAWKEGRTGYPLVDACMRCVKETGYLNFRMRAMVVSFLTHHLWLDWRKGAHYLAGMFLDFEPGIHYPQFQMQSGCTGANTIRIYNPVKQSYDKDPNAEFILQWVPELSILPPGLCHEPWKVSPMEQMMYNFQIGRDYPKPIVDLKSSQQKASAELHRVKKTLRAKQEATRIIARHVRSPKRRLKALG